VRIEAFSEGKNPDAPGANEDQFVVLPRRGFAVIDGVTDITGRVYDGMRTGQLASAIVQRAAAEFLADHPDDGHPEELVARATAALAAVYGRYGILDEVRADPARRFGATLTIAVDLGESFRFILIGDSGVRLNGDETIVVDGGLDAVTATLRQEAYRQVALAGGDLEAQRKVSRAASFHGAATLHPEMVQWIDERRLAALYRGSFERSRRRFPKAPEADIRWLLDRGVSGQSRFQNNTISPFSYAVLDGFEIPMSLVRVVDRPRATLRSIELFTDGYFKPGATPELATWEDSFREVERIDPEKINAYPSVKGSSDRMRTDDRTLVIVRF